MTRPADDHRREWRNGHSRLVIERDVGGFVRISVHDTDDSGYSVKVNSTVAAVIAEYLRGEQ